MASNENCDRTRGPPGQQRGDRVFPGDSRAASSHESAAAARRSRYGAGRTPGHRANPARAEPATPRAPDRSNGDAGDQRSVGRPPIDAAVPGVPGTVIPKTERGPQRKHGQDRLCWVRSCCKIPHAHRFNNSRIILICIIAALLAVNRS
jgi:hypothetical protein